MPQPLVKRLDQLTLATLALAALASMTVWVVAHHAGRSGLVDIDRAAPLRLQFLVDVNQAAWPELAQLPGVGEVLARRIVDERRVARFRTSEDLLRVQGIGPRKLAQIQRFLLPLPDDEMIAAGKSRSEASGS